MKRVYRLLAVVALSLFVGGMANAEGIKLGVNGGLQLPMGDFGEGLNLGFGGGISGEYLVNENIGIGLNAGYYIFGVDGADINLGYIPVALNGRYYFTTEGFKPYGGIDLGLYTISTPAQTFTETMDMGPLGTQTIEMEIPSVSASNFGIAPVLGFQYDFSDALALDVNAKYNLIFSEGASTSILGFGVGIVYTFGK